MLDEGQTDLLDWTGDSNSAPCALVYLSFDRVILLVVLYADYSLILRFVGTVGVLQRKLIKLAPSWTEVLWPSLPRLFKALLSFCPWNLLTHKNILISEASFFGAMPLSHSFMVLKEPHNINIRSGGFSMKVTEDLYSLSLKEARKIWSCHSHFSIAARSSQMPLQCWYIIHSVSAFLFILRLLIW